MRTVDRRDQLLRMLRRRADWTVADLARECGVSRRTVLRDLGALREAGFDLDTFSGPGGGSQPGHYRKLAGLILPLRWRGRLDAVERVTGAPWRSAD